MSEKCYQVPGTSITACFIPGASGSKYSPIYYGATGGRGAMGSTNAGNSQSLYVGSAGINGNAFEPALTGAGQDCTKYQTRHTALLSKAKSGKGDSETYGSDDPTLFSLVAPDSLNPQPGYYDGTVFIDVFASTRLPAGNANNAAMVYAAPPYGPSYTKTGKGGAEGPDPAAFKKAIEATAVNIVKVTSAYNKLAATNASLPALTVLRLCLYSSNIYNQNPKVPLADIALAIYNGLHGALQHDGAGLEYLEFPVGDHEFDAVEKLLAGN